MECASGGDLFAKVLAEGGCPEPAARFYLRQIALGLAYMHAQHLVHRSGRLRAPHRALLPSSKIYMR